MPGIAVFVQQRNVFDAEVLIGQNIQARHSERVKPTGTVAQNNAVFDFQTGFVQKLFESIGPGRNAELSDNDNRIVLSGNKFGQIVINRFSSRCDRPDRSMLIKTKGCSSAIKLM